MRACLTTRGVDDPNVSSLLQDVWDDFETIDKAKKVR